MLLHTTLNWFRLSTPAQKSGENCFNFSLRRPSRSRAFISAAKGSLALRVLHEEESGLSWLRRKQHQPRLSGFLKGKKLGGPLYDKNAFQSFLKVLDVLELTDRKKNLKACQIFGNSGDRLGCLLMVEERQKEGFLLSSLNSIDEDQVSREIRPKGVPCLLQWWGRYLAFTAVAVNRIEWPEIGERTFFAEITDPTL